MGEEAGQFYHCVVVLLLLKFPLQVGSNVALDVHGYLKHRITKLRGSSTRA